MSAQQAVAEVIKAAGFTQMAQDYLTRPDIREATVRAMTRNIRREFGNEKADAFARLAKGA